MTACFPLVNQSFAQEELKTEQWDRLNSSSIQDNSFLVEEAFNQEERVVQHISHIQYFEKPMREVEYSLTQEWPLLSMKHQFSFEIPYLSSGNIIGVGDVMLNYRYQLFDKEDGIAVAPRLSFILPTGDESKGLGAGVLGFEMNIPVSKRLAEEFIAHFNAGMSLFPNVNATTASGVEVQRTLPTYTLAASGIWLAHPDVNVMVEYVVDSSSEIDANGDVKYSTTHTLNPGLRVAINLDNLQIVPGIAIPIRFTDNETTAGVFGYLSFEHGF